MELITKLGIDVKILLAQIVNFLILLFVLKKFVFGLVLRKLDERREMIDIRIRAKQEQHGGLSTIDQRVLPAPRSSAVREADTQIRPALSTPPKMSFETLPRRVEVDPHPSLTARSIGQGLR